MAAVISDFADTSRFHNHTHTMIAGSGQQRSAAESSYRQRSRSRTDHVPSPGSHHASVNAGTPPPSTNASAVYHKSDGDGSVKANKSRPISPPSSSSPNAELYPKRRFESQENLPDSSAPFGRSPRPRLEPSDSRVSLGSEMLAQPSRPLDDVQKYGGNVIKVRDLAHIQSFATEEFLSYRGQSGRPRTADDPTLKYEISGMPITDIIEMVAGLLTKITTTNDRQHENLHRPIPSGDASVSMSGHSSSVLAFHGKNVPSITILSYLSRIHKYCPTTYEVFLSLLVYFDRMTERVNAAPMQALRRDSTEGQENSRPSTGYSANGSDLADSPPPSRAGKETSEDVEKSQYTHAPTPEIAAFPLSHFFVVDSFNIHRLVIAGVTCASKFFSDVFYTNSRYAKVRPPSLSQSLKLITNRLVVSPSPN
jgi:PHO85 cyclin-6/7